MTDSQIPPHNTSSKTKKVPIQERSFTMGNITGVNGYRVNRTLLKRRFAEGGYQVHETEHFLLFTRTEAPTTILVHRFGPESIDADIGYYFMQELKPLGILAQSENFGEVFGAVVCSLFPNDLFRALHLYGTNTLSRYHHLLTTASRHFLPSSPIDTFAQLYQRVCELLAGERFLDAGCSFGFLPLLVAERVTSLTHVVGADIRTDSFMIVRAIAEERRLKNVQFAQADLLADDFGAIGIFDTVTALHVLEHFTEADMYRVLTNLLKVASRRLILAVPFESGEPESAYGHEQLFSHTKLEGVARWCIQQLAGDGRMWYEDCAGGLLVIERTPPPLHDTTEQTREVNKKPKGASHDEDPHLSL
jgi:SAM-dependent methyltransferase